MSMGCVSYLMACLQRYRPTLPGVVPVVMRAGSYSGRECCSGRHRRVFDNILVERLWRTLKYDHRYLHDYATVAAVAGGLPQFIPIYKTERPQHESAP